MRKILKYILFLYLTVSSALALPSDLKYNVYLDDLNGMLKRNQIRVLVPYSKTFYFIDGAEQRGLTYELLKHFETFINEKFKRKTVKIKVVIIPARRDYLIEYIKKGYGDIAAGNLTITNERLKDVDFTDPIMSNISEVIVTGTEFQDLKNLEDLNLYLRKSSSYFESVQNINQRLKKAGNRQIKYTEANELLEDEDILEMMNAGLISMTVIDSHKAKFWEKVFPKLIFHYDFIIRDNASTAWAIRENSPELKSVLNQFVKKNKKGTYYGNIFYNKYLKDNKWVTNPFDTDSFKRLDIASPFFKKYSEIYDLDWLFIAAVAFQESKIDQSKRSPSGAVGVMQIMPSTANDSHINVKNIYFIGNNINAGAKYLKYLSESCVDITGVDKLNVMLFTLAAYNAGPEKLKNLRTEAEQSGYNKNKWFQNVEVVASKRIGNETVQYVSNIYKYYIAYLMLYDKFQEKKEIKNRLKNSKGQRK